MARGWRRFRRLPGILQAATWLALVAAYSLLMVVLLTGGDDDRSSVGTPRAAKPRPFTPLEEKVSALISGAPVGQGLPKERNDVQTFRRPNVRAVTCEGDACEVTYSLGLPGRGRILVDQRPMLERVFTQTDIQKLTLNVTRDTQAAGVPPKANEETPAGAPLLQTRCDRTKYKDVDWASAKGAQILFNICDVGGYDQGRIHRQDPVAAGDQTAGKDLDLPKPTPGD